ncbi:hypothetical protein ACJX0J_015362, partial [Zea mays]
LTLLAQAAAQAQGGGGGGGGRGGKKQRWQSRERERDRVRISPTDWKKIEREREHLYFIICLLIIACLYYITHLFIQILAFTLGKTFIWTQGCIVLL